MNTDQLIDRLSREARPVLPLRGPWARAAIWLAGVVLYLAAVALPMTSAADLAANGTGWKFLLPQLAAVATSAAAAVAAFASTVPGYSRRILWLPVIAASLWTATLAVQSIPEWNGGVSLAAPREWLCVAMIVGGGAVPAVVMMSMLRRGAPLSPVVTVALAALGVGGVANVSACLSHPHPSSLITLIWHGATILGVVGLAVVVSEHVLNWSRIRAGLGKSNVG